MTKKDGKIDQRDNHEYDKKDYSDLRKQRNKKRNKQIRHTSKDLLRDVKNGNIDYESFEEWSDF